MSASTKRRGGALRRIATQARSVPAQRALVDEIARQREPFLRAWWSHQLWQGQRLRTADGAPLEVLAPGWLNRGAGPDFTEARLLIDGREHWGDVEVHLDEDDWWRHGHQDDAGYGRVILHLVLRRGSRAALRPLSGEPLPVLEALPLLSPRLLDVMGDAEDMLRRYERLPGRCGLRGASAEPRAVQEVVAHAAEQRARAKGERILRGAEADSDEQLLYRTLSGYLGYRPHVRLFEALARRYPVESLAPLLSLPREEARREVLARWFGAAGLLESAAPESDEPAAVAEYGQLRQTWRALHEAPLSLGVVRRSARPWNSPERRLVGLFHHVHGLGATGWLKGWLGLLRKLDEVRDAPEFRSLALRLLEQAFDTPPDEPWRRRVSFSHGTMPRAARLIGRERSIVLMANAVLPLFLALARRDDDAELEKLLYRLYIVLPPEGANQRTRFMEQRLAPLTPLHRTLRTHQGLLQMHQDFCLSFHEGCERCGLPDLIAPPPP